MDDKIVGRLKAVVLKIRLYRICHKEQCEIVYCAGERRININSNSGGLVGELLPKHSLHFNCEKKFVKMLNT